MGVDIDEDQDDPVAIRCRHVKSIFRAISMRIREAPVEAKSDAEDETKSSSTRPEWEFKAQTRSREVIARLTVAQRQQVCTSHWACPHLRGLCLTNSSTFSF